MRWYWRNRGIGVVGGFGVSLLLHLLLVVGVEWWGEGEEEGRLVVRFEVPLPERERFKAVRPGAVPQVEMERVVNEDGPAVDGVDAVEVVAAPVEVATTLLWAELSGVPVPGGKEGGFVDAAEELPTLEEMQLELARRRAEALKAYAGRWMPDADTSDEVSRRRRRAEAVIDRAIAAMGGLEAMRGIKDKKVTNFFWSEGPGQRPHWRKVSDEYFAEGRKYREEAGGGRVRGYDGYRGWSYRYGVPQGDIDALLQQRAERWDFLSRTKGEGVLLDYIGERDLVGGRRGIGVLVEDVKFGGRVVMYFDGVSHLPIVTSPGPKRRTEMVEWEEDEGVKVPVRIWQVVGRNAWRERLDVDLNAGLGHGLFSDLGPRRWSRQAMRRLAQQSAEGAPTKVEVMPLRQEITAWAGGRPVDVVLDEASRRLLEYYLRQKLKAGGMLADAEGARHRIEWIVRGYFATQTRPPQYEMNIDVNLYPKEGTEPLRQAKVAHRWKAERFPALDGKVAEILTMLLVEKVGAGIAARHNEAAGP